jgi:glycosyltransferase involved in cell wall biosynthesis
MISRLVKRLRTSFSYRTGPILNRISIAIENRWPGKKSQDRLVILDEYFPNLFAAHRVAEFNVYLERFDDVKVYSTEKQFDYWLEEYGKHYPQFRNSVRAYDDNRILRGKGVYIVFLHNAFRFLEKVEEAGLPFVFELYPGGEFRLNDPVSDERLRRVLASPGFHKVIATQKITQDYLVERGFCDPDRIEFIDGGVFATDQLEALTCPKLRYGFDKDVVDICFVGFKHMPRGTNKGYDRFIETARLLARRNQQMRFHVVGSFDESDVEIGELAGRITFYGPQYRNFFPGFHANMDIILSPNIPFALDPGVFDGFPTGCCIEAGLCGVAVFMTDELAMNNGTFKDREEVVIISREPEEICRVVEEYLCNPASLAELATRGQQAFRRVFDLSKQMEPRLRILSGLLNVESGSGVQPRSEKHDN